LADKSIPRLSCLSAWPRGSILAGERGRFSKMSAAWLD
jgi:hypothetical protein